TVRELIAKRKRSASLGDSADRLRRPLIARSLAGRRIPMPRLPEVVMVSVEGVFNARNENPDDRYLVWRAATLARGPSVVLRLGLARDNCRRSRRQLRSHAAGALLPVLCRLATRWASTTRLGAGRPSTPQGAGRHAGDLWRSAQS